MQDHVPCSIILRWPAPAPPQLHRPKARMQEDGARGGTSQDALAHLAQCHLIPTAILLEGHLRTELLQRTKVLHLLDGRQLSPV
mmetsp:Transcript_37969/g.66023  ORF Transcript_37969/g.66023 Transcript_37969/m.66023 type:complete len:84 (-) Transcript_37969:146-397(-)